MSFAHASRIPEPPTSSAASTLASSRLAAGSKSVNIRSGSKSLKEKDNNKQHHHLGSTTGSASSASMKKSMRETHREQRKRDDAEAVAAASSALLDSIVPPQMINSASHYVLAAAPRVFSFTIRHMSSIRHPFFPMLCHENVMTDEQAEAAMHAFSDKKNDDGDNNDKNEHDNDSDNNDNKKSKRSTSSTKHNRHTGGSSSKRTTSSSHRGKTLAARSGIHRGGTSMTSTAHVHAVEVALKARRREWQTLPEYLVERFSDISSAYAIETERWKQTCYMYNSILLEDDLVRRRRDILESPHVIRALEACWTSWGGTTYQGIDFDTYREEHYRLFRTLMRVEAFDRGFETAVADQSISRDFDLDKEIVQQIGRDLIAAGRGGHINSFIVKQQQNATNANVERNKSPNTNEDNKSSRSSSPTTVKREVSVGGVSENTNTQQNQQQPRKAAEYEITFRRFCISMLELADNWCRVRVGENTSQVFAKFLMEIVRAPPKKKSKKKIQQQQIPVNKEEQEEGEGEEGENVDENDNKNIVETSATDERPVSKSSSHRSGSPVTNCFPPSMVRAAQNSQHAKSGFETALLQQQQQQQQQEIVEDEQIVGGIPVVVTSTGNQQSNINDNNRPGSGSSNRSDDKYTAESSSSQQLDEWDFICESLKRKARTHRGGPVVKLVPGTDLINNNSNNVGGAGIPPHYVSLDLSGNSNSNNRNNNDNADNNNDNENNTATNTDKSSSERTAEEFFED